MRFVKFLMVIFLLIGEFGIESYECGEKPNVYYSKSPCLKDTSNCPNNAQLLPNRKCQTAADCQYTNEFNQMIMGNCYKKRCCTAVSIQKCPNGQIPLDQQCSKNQDCSNGQCSNGQCCGSNNNRQRRRRGRSRQQNFQTICPNEWQVSNFGCNSDQQCYNGQSQGVCRQQRCCFGDNNQIQGCSANERNTGQQCWNNQQCSFGSIWGMATCRNGYCCESIANNNINQPSPACEQGTAIASPCTHDTQCWLYGQQNNQLATCQNGHCCISTCQNGGRPTGRQCSQNARDCVYLSGTNYLMGVCDQGTCCSNNYGSSLQQFG